MGVTFLDHRVVRRAGKAYRLGLVRVDQSAGRVITENHELSAIPATAYPKNNATIMPAHSFRGCKAGYRIAVTLRKLDRICERIPRGLSERVVNPASAGLRDWRWNPKWQATLRGKSPAACCGERSNRCCFKGLRCFQDGLLCEKKYQQLAIRVTHLFLDQASKNLSRNARQVGYSLVDR